MSLIGIRYFAFQAAPLEPPKHLNPLWPVDGERFLDANYADTHRDQGSSLVQWDELDRTLLFLEFESNAIFLCTLASKDESSAILLQRLCRTFVLQIVELVRDDNHQAIQTLAEIAHLSTAAISALGAQHPIIKEIAKEEIEWPMIHSNISTLSSKVYMSDLPLSMNLFPSLSTASRFDISNAVGQIALRLYQYVRSTRSSAIRSAKRQGIMLDQLRQDGKVRQLSIEESAAILPDFSKESMVIASWWNVAERCLVEAYQHPELDRDSKPQLNQTEPILRALVTAKTHVKAGEGTIRSKILEKMENSFCSFGGMFKGKDKGLKKTK